MVNDSIGMRIEKNTGFGKHFTLGTPLPGNNCPKKLAARSKAGSRFWVGAYVWFFCWIFFHCLVAQILLEPQNSSFVLLHHATLAIAARLLLPKCCAWFTSTTKESSRAATCIWTGIIHFLKSDVCCFVFTIAGLENANPPKSLNK